MAGDRPPNPREAVCRHRPRRPPICAAGKYRLDCSSAEWRRQLVDRTATLPAETESRQPLRACLLAGREQRGFIRPATAQVRKRGRGSGRVNADRPVVSPILSANRGAVNTSPAPPSCSGEWASGISRQRRSASSERANATSERCWSADAAALIREPGSGRAGPIFERRRCAASIASNLRRSTPRRDRSARCRARGCRAPGRGCGTRRRRRRSTSRCGASPRARPGR